MTHRYTIEAAELSLRDLCNQNQIFGGKIVIFGGDFRQILLVVTKGTGADIVASSVSRAAFGLTAIFNILEPICSSCIQI